MRDFAEHVLELAKRSAAWAEVFLVSSEETPVAFEANRLRSIEARETRGVALRVVAEGRIGLASSSRLEDAQALVDDALATARFGAQAALAYPAEPVAEGALDLYDKAVAALSTDDMVQMGQQMVDRVRKRGGDDILVDADVRKAVGTVTVRNSSGGQGSYRKTVLSIDLHANRTREDDLLDIYESDASCHLAGVALTKTVNTLLGKLELSSEIAQARTGSVPVIFTPKGVAITLLAPLAAALSGKAVLEGSSPLAGRLGERMFDPGFSLIDDGLVPRQPASAPCDDEGVPMRRTALVEGGRLNAYYYDLQTAGRAGTQSTGNGERGLATLPAPATHALRIPAGTASYQHMLADVEDGLVVDQTMGAWAGNLLSGDFSGNVHLGFKVRRGQLVGRVKNTMVTGNVFRALGRLAGIGDRAYWLDGRAEVPYLYFSALSVATR
ncbi:MAG TPA: TldD/PmbA family protein [Anaerolineae bacterium]|nr:TldD/PmbA family protein [Anaerolineae bacterium]HOQ99309.1 TldD/PmbA family protein [Anaerolineae bacterium]HPL28666.1 TldD/PmbA family protein [Anaerolineae bacterium]